jgi:hypothetical protein
LPIFEYFAWKQSQLTYIISFFKDQSKKQPLTIFLEEYSTCFQIMIHHELFS